MSEIEQWSQVDADNDDLDKGGMPEGQNRSSVNDQARDRMGAIRRFFEDGQWVDLTKENGGDFSVAKTGVKTFIVTDLGGLDASSKFLVGSWLKVTGTGSPTVVYGNILSSSYSDPVLTVVLDTVVDGSYVASDLPSATVTKVECFFARYMRQAAFHTVGATLAQAPAEIPTIDDLGDQVTRNGGHDPAGDGTPGLDADTIDGMHADEFQQTSSGFSRNSIANASMAVWQRGNNLLAVTPANEEYVADRWMLVHDASSWTVYEDLTFKPTGLFSSMALYANTSTAKKVGICQILTARDSAAIVGDGTATLSYWALVPVSTTISKCRAAILEWTGAADFMKSRLVSAPGSWGAEGTDPTLAAGWAYADVIANPPSANQHLANANWVRVLVEGIAIDPLTKNLAVFIWIDDTSYGGGDQWNITGVQLEPGANATMYRDRARAEEMALCLPHYQTSYARTALPGVTVTSAGSVVSSDLTGDVRFKPPMFDPASGGPNVKFLVYSTSTAAVGKVFAAGGGGDLTGTISNVGTNGMHVSYGGGTPPYRFHYIAETEL